MRSWAGAGRQEEQAGVFWKMSVFKEEYLTRVQSHQKGKIGRTQAMLFPPGWTFARRQTRHSSRSCWDKLTKQTSGCSQSLEAPDLSTQLGELKGCSDVIFIPYPR